MCGDPDLEELRSILDRLYGDDSEQQNKEERESLYPFPYPYPDQGPHLMVPGQEQGPSDHGQEALPNQEVGGSAGGSGNQPATNESRRINQPRQRVGDRCTVCNAKATGFRYGAVICEGCKYFFLRAVRGKKKYTCKKDGRCPIERGIRRMCRSCRYNKCIEAGMESSMVEERRHRSNPQPCAVCGVDTFSVLYGVPACNACALFFRRTVLCGLQYTCNYDHKCPVNRVTRASCQSCRFAKCIEVGMEIPLVANSLYHRHRDDTSRNNDEQNDEAQKQTAAQSSSQGTSGQDQRKRLNQEMTGSAVQGQSNPGGVPKCSVCGDDALESLFGIFACAPCWKFFERSVLYGAPFSCAYNKCHVDKANWKSCRSCRFEKCIEVGMEGSMVRSVQSQQLENETARNQSARLVDAILSSSCSAALPRTESAE